MSPSGYDGSHLSSNYSRYDQRRHSSSMSNAYDRPPALINRRRTPSPGPSRRPYDSYPAPRSDSSFRDPASSYRQTNYRHDYYYSRSPSPDHYQPQPRSSDSDAWGRSTSSWRPPSVSASLDWSDRKSIPPSPTTIPSRRPTLLRDEFPSSSRQLFEPSEHWKQTHGEGSRNDINSPPARVPDRRHRNSLDGSSEKSLKNDRAPPFIPSGDRYRLPPPPPKRDSLPPRDYDSYRPQFSDNKSLNHRRDPVSPMASHSRKSSGSMSFSQSSSKAYDNFAPSYAAPQPRKPSASPSSLPSPAAVSPVHSPNWSSTHGSEHQPWSFPSGADLSKRDTSALRPPSRSSIASTQVSGRNSPFMSALTPSADIAQSTSITPNIINSVNKVLSATVDVAASSQPTNIPSTTEEKLSLPERSELSASTPMIPALNNFPEVIHSPSPRETNREDDDDDAIPGLTASLIGSTSAPTTLPAEQIEPTSHTPSNDAPSEPHDVEVPATEAQPEIPATVETDNVPQPVEDSMEVVEEANNSAPDLEANDREPTEPIQEEVIEVEPVPHDSPFLRRPETPEPDIPSIPEEIPPIHTAKTKEDALRIVVMARLLCDRQRREERVDPILVANLSIASIPEVHPTANPESLLDKMFAGQAMKRRSASFARTRPLLSKYFEQRDAMIEEKQSRLREEYLALHEEWVAHCNALNEQQKTLASEMEVHHTGRTTRRTAAVTDIIRSDFEMEQIIASLGNDDATDPNHLSIKNVATIPDMISATRGKVDYLFDDTAHRVDNPSEYYAPQTGMHDWTEQEKKIFVDKYAAHPKQFGIIADYLPNKTAAQCVDYYYLHKKRHIDFRKIVSQFAPNKRRRRGMGKKKGNALLADIAQHDMEVGRNASGGASSPSGSGRTRGRRNAANEARKAAAAARRNAVQFEETPVSTPTPEPESRSRRRKPATGSALATTPANATPADSASATPAPPNNAFRSASVASTPVPPSPLSRADPPTSTVPASSTQRSVSNQLPSLSTAGTSVATAMDEGDTPDQDGDSRPAKRAKRSRKIKSAATVSDEEHSDAGKGNSNRAEPSNAARGKKDSTSQNSVVTLSKEDSDHFVRLFEQYGEDFGRIAAYMPNMTPQQAANYHKANPAKFEKLKSTRRVSDGGSRSRSYSTAQTPLDLRPQYPVPMMTHANAHLSTAINPYTYGPSTSSHPMMDSRLHHYPTSAPTSPPPSWGLVAPHAIPGGIAPYPGLPTSLPMARLGDAPPVHQMSDPSLMYGSPTLAMPFTFIPHPSRPQGNHTVPPRSASEAGYHYSRPGAPHSPASGVEQSYNPHGRPLPPTAQAPSSQGHHSRSSSYHQPQSPPASTARSTPTLHQPKATHPSPAATVAVPITHSPEPGASSYHPSGAFAGSATPPPANGGRYSGGMSREASVPYAPPTVSPGTSPRNVPAQLPKGGSSATGRYSYDGNNRDEFAGGPYYPNRREAAYSSYSEANRSNSGAQPSGTTPPVSSTSTSIPGPQPRPTFYRGWGK
ncbi:hypothetical protein CVT24_002774 [Panaeolus cyanescens]|uniref:SANT domain-containing protein n=1 Tax=Panaeolus cyanescens TaxID=181874 RepID=A0A409VNC9_9AGAR|nr:hypothetical protein CVT24_002774 [Panaeolus cyanescens]